jgi:hypothetical protein
MARTRHLKIGLYRNEVLAQLPFEGRMLFAGLPLIADRAGRLEDRPLRIKAELFPFDDVKVDGLLADLAEREFITRYQVDGVAVIQITKFVLHQAPHPKEPPSELPENPRNSEKSRQATEGRGRQVSSPSLALTGSSGSALTGSTQKNVSSMAQKTAPVEPAAPSPAVLVYPCQGTPQTWPLTEAQLAEWRPLYRPGLDIEAECRKALAWVLANPGHQKTARGMKAFLVKWLNRTVDRGATSGRGQDVADRRQPPAVNEVDWAEECQRLHNRRCNGRYGHALQMQLDAAKKVGV